MLIINNGDLFTHLPLRARYFIFYKTNSFMIFLWTALFELFFYLFILIYLIKRTRIRLPLHINSQDEVLMKVDQINYYDPSQSLYDWCIQSVFKMHTICFLKSTFRNVKTNSNDIWYVCKFTKIQKFYYTAFLHIVSAIAF